MAAENSIFEQFMSWAVLELSKEGIIRGDYDWDVFRRGRGINYTIRVVDQTDGKPLVYFVIKRKANSIIVLDELSKKQKEYDFSPETRNLDGFVGFMSSFAKELMKK